MSASIINNITKILFLRKNHTSPNLRYIYVPSLKALVTA